MNRKEQMGGEQEIKFVEFHGKGPKERIAEMAKGPTNTCKDAEIKILEQLNRLSLEAMAKLYPDTREEVAAVLKRMEVEDADKAGKQHREAA